MVAVPAGRSRISAGDDVARPVLQIRGGRVINLKHLDIESGFSDDARRAAGIDYSGHGSLTLEDVRIADNRNSRYYDGAGGLLFEGAGGTAYLQFLDDVSVVDNVGNGVTIFGSAVLTMGALGNKLARNWGSGLRIESPAIADISAPNAVFDANEKYGLEILHRADTSAPLVSRLYMANNRSAVGFRANKRGALHMEGAEHNADRYSLCVQNTFFEDHILVETQPNGTPDAAFGSLVRVVGPLASLHMSDECAYPPDASPAASRFTSHRNVMADGKPLFAVSDGALAVFDRGTIFTSTANAIFSTNLGESASDASLYVYNTLVGQNVLRDAVIESLNGADVVGLNLTIADNSGSFGQTLTAIDASFLVVFDSIIDQPQPLLYVEGDRSGVVVKSVLAQNGIGTGMDDRVIEGQPVFGAAYELAPWSPGVDYAAAFGGERSADARGLPRNVDTLGVPDGFGPRDLGAVELQLLDYDTLFRNGFDPVGAGAAE